jgi:hypothetical protein
VEGVVKVEEVVMVEEVEVEVEESNLVVMD